ncbi:MAG: EAL and HDOD domain-containing protein [Lachnotalea sp.]
MFIARQPIFNKDMKVYGYELLFRAKSVATSFGEFDSTIATATVVNNLFETGIDQIVDRTRAFINFDYNFILSDAIELINPKTLVIEVLESVGVDDLLVARLKYLKMLGYKIALDDFVEDFEEYQLVPITDIIKYDIRQTPLESIGNEINKALEQNKILLAEKIETEEEFIQAKQKGFHLFQGYFFSKPCIVSKTNEKASTKTQYLRLLSELKKEESSYNNLSELIETDLNFAYRLMKVASTKQSEELGCSIKKTLMYMGFKNIERWINILMLQDLASEKPTELLKLSLIRSKFGEFIAENSKYKKQKSEVIMMCLFSVIDAILDVTMKEALSEIALTDEVRNALIHQSGELFHVCELIGCYEKGNWEQVKFISNQIGIANEKLASGYLLSLRYVDEIFDMF